MSRFTIRDGMLAGYIGQKPAASFIAARKKALALQARQQCDPLRKIARDYRERAKAANLRSFNTAATDEATEMLREALRDLDVPEDIVRQAMSGTPAMRRTPRAPRAARTRRQTAPRAARTRRQTAARTSEPEPEPEPALSDEQILEYLRELEADGAEPSAEEIREIMGDSESEDVEPAPSVDEIIGDIQEIPPESITLVEQIVQDSDQLTEQDREEILEALSEQKHGGLEFKSEMKFDTEADRDEYFNARDVERSGEESRARAERLAIFRNALLRRLKLAIRGRSADDSPSPDEKELAKFHFDDMYERGVAMLDEAPHATDPDDVVKALFDRKTVTDFANLRKKLKTNKKKRIIQAMSEFRA